MTNLQTGLVGFFAVLLIAAIPGIWIQVGFEEAAANAGETTVLQRAEPALEPGTLEPVPAPDRARLPEVTFNLSPVGADQLRQERGTSDWIRLMEQEDRDRFGVTYQSAGSAGRININDASASQLQQLQGVGPATSEAIIEAREEWGGIYSFYELDQIRGVGGAMIDRLIDEIHFDGRVPQRMDDS